VICCPAAPFTWDSNYQATKLIELPGAIIPDPQLSKTPYHEQEARRIDRDGY